MKHVILLVLLTVVTSCKIDGFQSEPNWCCRPDKPTAPINPIPTTPLPPGPVVLLNQAALIDLSLPADQAAYGAFLGTRYNRYYEFSNGFMPFNEFGTLITESEMDDIEADRDTYSDYSFTSPGLALDEPATDVVVLHDSAELLVMVGNTVISGENKMTILKRDRLAGQDHFISHDRFPYDLGGNFSTGESGDIISLYNNDVTFGIRTYFVSPDYSSSTISLNGKVSPTVDFTYWTHVSNENYSIVTFNNNVHVTYAGTTNPKSTMRSQRFFNVDGPLIVEHSSEDSFIIRFTDSSTNEMKLYLIDLTYGLPE